MPWLPFALLAPFLHGAATVLDGHLANRLFRNTWTLVCFGALANAAFIPFVFLLSPPDILPLTLVPYVIAIGLIEFAYLYPYLRALRHDDVSVVIALFTLGKIFIPVLAWFLVGETLSFSQYAGFIVIVGASALLTLNGKRRLRFNASLPLMALASLLIALQAVLYKGLFQHVSWGTGFVWPSLVTGVGALVLMALRRDVREEASQIIRKRQGTVGLFCLEELFSFAGSACATFTMTLTPVTIQQGIGAIQPLFVLSLGILLHRWFPQATHERGFLLKKIVLFIVMVVGVLLVGGADL